jgi:hypothetical protein
MLTVLPAKACDGAMSKDKAIAVHAAPNVSRFLVEWTMQILRCESDLG